MKTTDLVSALKEGKIWGAGLDVVDPEPIPDDHPLKSVDRVVIAPHAACAVPGMIESCHKAVIRGLKAVLIDGQPPPKELLANLSTE